MRSNRQSKTGAIQLRKTAARKIKRHRDRRVNKQSSGAVVADLKYRCWRMTVRDAVPRGSPRCLCEMIAIP